MRRVLSFNVGLVLLAASRASSQEEEVAFDNAARVLSCDTRTSPSLGRGCNTCQPRLPFGRRPPDRRHPEVKN